MTVREIYEKYSIPPNLQEHMLFVNRVAVFISRHWTGPKIDWTTIQKSALLHDLGNIVKFNFDIFPEFLGLEKTKIEYWKSEQLRIVKKYGNDDHVATQKMLGEIGVDKKIVDTILNKSFGNSVRVSAGSDWAQKILLYCDLRVLPLGICTLEERLEDIKKRFPKYTSRSDFDDLLAAAYRLENQIQDNLDISVIKVDKNSVMTVDSSEYLQLEI